MRTNASDSDVFLPRRSDAALPNVEAVARIYRCDGEAFAAAEEEEKHLQTEEHDSGATWWMGGEKVYSRGW